MPLRKEVQLALGDLCQFLNALIVWVLDKADNEPTKLSALYMLSSIINRRSNGKLKLYADYQLHIIYWLIYEELSSFLNDKLSVFWFKEIQDRTLPVERRVWAIKSWTWVLFVFIAISYCCSYFLLFRVRYARHYLYRNIRWRWISQNACMTPLMMHP